MGKIVKFSRGDLCVGDIIHRNYVEFPNTKRSRSYVARKWKIADIDREAGKVLIGEGFFQDTLNAGTLEHEDASEFWTIDRRNWFERFLNLNPYKYTGKSNQQESSGETSDA